MGAIRRLVITFVLAICVLAAPTSAAAQIVFESTDLSEFPTVSMSVRLPKEVVSVSSPAISVRENSVEVAGATIEPVGGEQKPVDIVLLLDVSGSMAGEPLSAAKEAARLFVQGLGPQDRVALISFASRPEELVRFTSDKSKLLAAISGLSARGETALHDGIVDAAALLGESDRSARYVVLLSDGGDTVSGASLDDAERAVMRAEAVVYAVALVSPEYDAAPLKTLAAVSGGKFLSSADPGAFSAMFSGIAEELHDVYLVRYSSLEPATKDLEIAVTAEGGGERAEAVVVVANPMFEAALAPAADSSSASAATPPIDTFWTVLSLSGVAILVFAATAMFSWWALSQLARKRGPLDGLSFYDQVRHEKSVDDSPEAPADETMKARVLSAVDRLATPRGFTALIKARIDRTGLSLRPLEFIYFHLVGVLVIGSAVWIGSRSLMAFVISVALASALPLVVLDVLIARRRAAFERQLPDILSLIAGSLRAGWGVQQSIELVVEQSSDPARSEFSRAQAQMRLGMQLEVALGAMAERLDSADFRWTVTAIGIQREVGGNLAEVLDTVASTIRERVELRRHVSSLTAEGRFSGIVLAILPFLLLAGMAVVSPGYLGAMFVTPIGWMLLVFGLLLLIVGSVWMLKLTKVEV